MPATYTHVGYSRHVGSYEPDGGEMRSHRRDPRSGQAQRRADVLDAPNGSGTREQKEVAGINVIFFFAAPIARRAKKSGIAADASDPAT